MNWCGILLAHERPLAYHRPTFQVKDENARPSLELYVLALRLSLTALMTIIVGVTKMLNLPLICENLFNGCASRRDL